MDNTMPICKALGGLYEWQDDPEFIISHKDVNWCDCPVGDCLLYFIDKDANVIH